MLYIFFLQIPSKCCTIEAQKAMALWNGWYAPPYPRRLFYSHCFLLQEEEYQSALPANKEGHPLVEGWVPFDAGAARRSVFLLLFKKRDGAVAVPFFIVSTKPRRSQTRNRRGCRFYASFRSFSLIQPFLRSTAQNSVLSTAGNTKQISTSPAQSKAVMVLPICTQPV